MFQSKFSYNLLEWNLIFFLSCPVYSDSTSTSVTYISYHTFQFQEFQRESSRESKTRQRVSSFLLALHVGMHGTAKTLET
jgi:hypothetical protein